jgi:hypothetical protein
MKIYIVAELKSLRQWTDIQHESVVTAARVRSHACSRSIPFVIYVNYIRGVEAASKIPLFRRVADEAVFA